MRNEDAVQRRIDFATRIMEDTAPIMGQSGSALVSYVNGLQDALAILHGQAKVDSDGRFKERRARFSGR